MKKHTTKFLCCLLVLVLSKLNAQLSGAYTVPGSYATIGAAIADLNTLGVSGAVTINIAAGYTETAPVNGYTLNSITGASAANQITFRKSGAGANPIITAYAGGTATPISAIQDGVWKFSGSDYITVDGINITDPNTVNPATMEYGFGFFKASATDGCNNNTIKNCVITLNRINNAVGSSPALDGSRGIDVVNAQINTHTVAVTVTAVSGANSNNKFYSNTIQNCNYGIALVGFADATPFALADVGNDIGGASAATGNSIINFGGGGSLSPAVAIRPFSQYGFNASYNIINSNTGAGVDHAEALRGIFLGAATSANATVSSNTISLKGGGTSQAVVPIENASGATAASNSIIITNNLINNCTYVTATSGVFYGIRNSASAAYLSIANNTITNNSTNATSGSYYNIYNSGAVTTTINMSNNLISLGTFSATSTSLVLAGVYNSAGSSASTLNILSNTLQSAAYMGATGGTGDASLIFNSGTRAAININSNNFNNITLKTTGVISLIYDNTSTPITNVNNNLITTGFANTVANSNYFYGYYNYGSPGSGTATFIGNNFSNISLQGSMTFYGLYQATSASQVEIFTNNIIANVTNTTGILNGLYHNYGAAGSAVTGNTVTGFNGASVNAILLGNSSAATSLTVALNIVGSHTSVAASGQVVGIFHVAGNASSIFKNKVYNLNGNGTGNVVGGIYILAGGSVDIYNNTVGDLKTPITSGTPISGIYVGPVTSSNIYYNTVNLAASSTAPNFGSTAIYISTTPVVNLRNNIFVNNSTPAGTGATYAYYRSGTSLTNYSTTSNNNLYYAGTPSASRLIYYDGTNSLQTLGAFKAFMVTRDGLSVTEDPTFASTVGTNANFLNINPSIATQIESGGLPIAGITDDFAGTTRNVTTPDIGAFEGGFTAVLTCTGVPSANTLVSSQSAVCPSVGFSMFTASSYTVPGITYQWLSSTTNSTSGFASIPNATLSAYTNTNLTASTWYQLNVTCSNSGSTFTVPPIQVVTGPPTLNSVSNASFMCNGQTANLSLSSSINGVSYQWLTSTTGSNTGYAAITNATLATRTNSGVIGANWFQTVLSCTANSTFSTTTNPVNVTVGAVPTASAAVTLSTVCAANNVNLQGTTDIGTIFSWTGPSNFTSSAQNPIFTNGNTGLYSLVTSLNTCSSTAANVSVTILGKLMLNPATAIPSNICLGGSTQMSVNDYATSKVNNYSFSSSAGTSLLALTTGSTGVIGTGVDDTPMPLGALGFTFNYNGVDYTQYSASPDGWVKLGGPGANEYANAVTATVNYPKFYPYWDDLATGTNGYVRSQLIGTAPTRTFVIEWFVTIPRATSGAANSTFQALLHEATGKVEFRYGAMGTDNAGASSVGLTGDATTFNCLTLTGPTNSTVTPDDNNLVQPAPGTSYVFTPPAIVYAWSPSANLSSSSAAVVTGTPGASTVYSVNLTYGGCLATKTIAVNVTTPPVVNITPSSMSICPGASATLTASGADTYSWNTTSTNTVIIVSPTANVTTYTVDGFTGACKVPHTINISIPGNPTISLSGSSGICTGQIASLTANAISAAGAITYSWANNGAITNSITDTPSTPTIYTVTATDAIGCSTTTTQLVNVAASLLIAINGPTAICVGESTTLTASGGVTYLWDGGATTNTLLVNPTTGTEYTVVGSSGTCSNSATYSLIVHDNPTVTVTGNTVICNGNSTTLTANGASTYTWNGALVSPTNTLSPMVNTTYTVAGTSSLNCTTSLTFAVVSNTLPAINIVQTSTAVCAGNSATLTASGADTFTWNVTGSPTTTMLTVSPSANTVYTVSGTNVQNCVASQTIGVVSNTVPVVAIAPSSATVCSMSSVGFTGSGASTYTWNNNSSLTTPAISFTPASSTNYSLTGTSAEGCTATAVVAVTTKTLPVIAITPPSVTVCAQSISSFSATGADTYLWNGSVSGGTVNLYNPSNITHTVIGTSLNGCFALATVSVTTTPLPVLSSNPPGFTTVCINSANTYTGSGAVTYTWNGTVNNATAVLTPTGAAVSFTLEGTDALGCVGTLIVPVLTYSLPAILTTPNTPTICSLSSATFVASGANSYVWSAGVVNGATVVVTPTVNTTYTVTGTDANNCVGTKTFAVVTKTLPVIGISPASSVCIGSAITLTASGANSFNWSSGDNTSFTSVSPALTTVYTVTGNVVSTGCKGTATVEVTVNALPTIGLSASPSATMCIKETSTITPSGGVSYTLTPGNSTSTGEFTVSPNNTTTYTAVGWDANGCENTSSVVITVDKCTGINENSSLSSFISVFPNPSTGKITAEFGFEGKKTIFVINSVGALVATTTTEAVSESLDLSHLAKGVYFVRIDAKGTSNNYKIIIQ